MHRLCNRGEIRHGWICTFDSRKRWEDWNEVSTFDLSGWFQGVVRRPSLFDLLTYLGTNNNYHGGIRVPGIDNVRSVMHHHFCLHMPSLYAWKVRKYTFWMTLHGLKLNFENSLQPHFQGRRRTCEIEPKNQNARPLLNWSFRSSKSQDLHCESSFVILFGA